MVRTFKGGVHPREAKEATSSKPTGEIQPPEIVIVPLSQHTGAPAKPVVKAGDDVKIGSKIAEADGFGFRQDQGD
jgi:electron transport complex protein RnfC